MKKSDWRENRDLSTTSSKEQIQVKDQEITNHNQEVLHLYRLCSGF